MARSIKKLKTKDCSEEDGILDFQQQGLQNQAKQLQLEDILRSFVYAAAETGARELIEVLFSFSVGKIVFEAYKNECPLPENVAEDNGHNDIASYLRGVTKRYSKEDSTCPRQSKIIDWLELGNALEEITLVQSEPSSDKDGMWKDISETGYSADDETSSSDLENEKKSDSDDEYKRISISTVIEEDEKGYGSESFPSGGNAGKSSSESVQLPIINVQDIIQGNCNQAMAAFSDRHLEPEKAETRFGVTSLAFQKVNFSTRRTLKVIHLGSAWNSSAGGLSTLNRELAIQLSKHPNMEVSLFVPEGACKDVEKREAQSCGVTVVDAKERPGFDPLDWLSFPPKDLGMDVVVGHGVKLGRQGQVIRDLDHFPNCKWVQVVHTAPEDLSKFNRYADPISKGERKHRNEVELCKLADLVVPVGPLLKEAYSSYLRRNKTDGDIFSVTPGLFDREFGDLKQSPNEDAEFKVLIFGRGDDEDFELKGYNIAAKAFTDHRLKQKSYHLLFVGAPDGKVDGIRKRLIQCGIDENQLTVRSYIQSRDKMKDLFCEVHLAIMPSKTEGFGLVALEALSAGLPILVGSRSGFAKALEKLPDGKSCIVYSDEPTKWAEAIEAVRVRHKMWLEDIRALRASYGKKYSWKEQCEALAEKLWRMVDEQSNAGVKKTQADEQHPLAVLQEPVYKPHLSQQPKPIDEKRIFLEKGGNAAITSSNKNRRSAEKSKSISLSTSEEDIDFPVEKELAMNVSGKNEEGALSSRRKSSQSISKTTPDTGTQAVTVQLKITTPDLNDQQQEVFDDLIQNMLLFMDNHDPSKAEGQLGALIQYLVKSHKLLFKRFTNNGLEILLECPNLENLASLLKDHRSGHLNEVAERHIVTDKIKEILNLETVRLKTVFEEETRVSEMLGVAGIIRFPSKQNAPDQGASAKWTDTSPKRQKSFQVNKEVMNWMIRSEKAKASRSALHKASISGQCDTVKMLLESGQQVDQRDRFSLTPLHLACWYGQESVVKLLLEHGANVNAVDRFERTPLQKAERHNHRSIVQLLLKSNASPSYQQPLSLKSLARQAILKVDRRSGFNLLQAAVFEGEDNIVFCLIVLLEDVVKEMSLKTTGNDARVFPGKTAVNILSSLEEKRPGHAKIDKWYLEDVEKDSTLTELHRCKSLNDAEKAVELVLNDGVDINIPALCNRTPLLWASTSSSSEFIETLIDLGADINAQRTDHKVTPLKLAANWSNYMAVYVFSEHGADANIQDDSGCTPLQFSVEKGQENLVKLLLKNNADVNSQNIYGDAPLHNSVRGGFFNISQLLIEAGSNVNLRNKKGRTPLYIAVKNKHEQLIELLLESNADVSMGYKEDPKERIYLVRGKDKGKPAWHYVLVEKHLVGLFHKRTKQGSLDVADYGTVLESGWGNDPPKNTIDKILKKHEYDPMFKEIQGETLLHVASRNANAEITEMLVKNGAWDVNARDAEGFTPLHVAAIHGNMQAVKKLVNFKADVNQAIGIADFAHMNEEFEIEEYLKSKMDSRTTKRNEVERDDTMANVIRGARVISRKVARVRRLFVDSVTRALNFRCQSSFG